jgi:hypothetical protein
MSSKNVNETRGFVNKAVSHFADVQQSKYKEKIISMIRIVKAMTMIMFTLLLHGCSTAPVFTDISGTAINPEFINNCQLIGPIKGASMGDSFLSSMGFTSDSKNQVIKNAKEMGATHILWGMLRNGYTPYTFGDAYRCVNIEQIPKNMKRINTPI